MILATVGGMQLHANITSRLHRGVGIQVFDTPGGSCRSLSYLRHRTHVYQLELSYSSSARGMD